MPEAAAVPVSRNGSSRILWDLLFFGGLAATLCSGSHIWIARIGWVVLAMVFMTDFEYAFDAIFFYCAFFQPAGFLQGMPFTVKHFHIAVFLLALSRLILGYRPEDFNRWLRQIRPLIPLYLMLGIGLLGTFQLAEPEKSFRIIRNLILVTGLMTFWSSLLPEAESEASAVILDRGFQFYLAGTAIKVIGGALNTIFKTQYLGMDLIHNNHIGMLCAMSIFYALALQSQPQPLSRRLFYLLITVVLLGGLVASCSRTAWFSFLGSYLIYSWLIHHKKRQLDLARECRAKRSTPVLLFLAIAALLSFVNDDILSRLKNLPQLLDPAYWQYTLHDQQNFGFLGIYRLRDLRELKAVFLQHPFFGAGFPTQVVDMHGLYFTFLAATGSLGLLLFLFCQGSVLRQLGRGIFQDSGSRTLFLKISCFCALTTWGFGSLMETYFLQFFLWVPVMLAILWNGAAHAPKSCAG